MPAGDQSLVYENVSFGFGDRQLYEDLSCAFAPGGCYAILGESGSGKSTLTKLLLKYYGCRVIVGVNGLVALQGLLQHPVVDLTGLGILVFGLGHPPGKYLLEGKGDDGRNHSGHAQPGVQEKEGAGGREDPHKLVEPVLPRREKS